MRRLLKRLASALGGSKRRAKKASRASKTAQKPRVPVKTASAKRARKPKPAALEPLYARLSGPEVLAHTARAALLREIEKAPGSGLPELSRALDLASTTVAWHLRTLEREGFIVGHQDGRTRRFFLPGTDRTVRRKTSALSEASRRRLVDVVRDNPGVTQERLAELSGLARATVWHHARRLEADGLVKSAREGRERRYFVG